MESPPLAKSLLGAAALGVMVLGVAALLAPPEVLTGGHLMDTDAYMRLVRVRNLLESGAWFDSTIPRSNWPAGDTLHWTRPLDIPLVLGTWIAAPFVGMERGLALAGFLVAPLLLLGIFAATGWAGDPLVGRRNRGFVLLGLLPQLSVVAYALPGRPDHHALIVMAFAVSLGFALRGFLAPERRAWAVGLGVSAGFGLWVSTEFLLPLGLFLAAGMWLWIRHGRAHLRFNLAWTIALLATMAAALVVERGPGLLAVEYDRISVVHMVVAGLAAAVWGALAVRRASGGGSGAREEEGAGGGADGRPGIGGEGEAGGSVSRGVAGAVAGVAALAVMALLFPPFFRGPMVEVTDPVVLSWLRRVAELQPMVTRLELAAAGTLLIHLGPALLAMGHLTWRLRHREGAGGEARVLLLAGLVVCLGLSLVQVRWVVYVQIMAALGVADLLVHVRRHVAAGREESGSGLLVRASFSAAVLAGPFFLGLLILLLAPGTGGAETAATGGAERCDQEGVAAFLGQDPVLGATPRTVAAFTDLGPAILWRTHHRVMATPYHRNTGGIRGAHDILAATDPDRARALAEVSEVGIIVLCPRQDAGFFPDTVGGEPTLYRMLLEDRIPGWLSGVPVPEELDGVRVFVTR